MNLDAFNAAFGALDTDEAAELAAFAKGLHKGLNAGRLRDGASEAMAVGFDLGQAFRLEAEAKRAKSKAGGQISAANRAMKYGTAQPPGGGFEGTSEPLRGDIEDCSNQSMNDGSMNESNELPTNLDARRGASSPSLSRPVSLTPLRSQEAIDAFADLWSTWPATRPADNKPAKGNRVPAERAFQGILDSGVATAEELVRAVKLYLGHHPNVKNGYVVHVSTFFGPEKGLWAEAVRKIRDHQREEGAGDSQGTSADYLDALNAEVS